MTTIDVRGAPVRACGPAEDTLLDGFNHVAVLTSDAARLVAFYREVFGATVNGTVREESGLCLTLVKVGPAAELNIFEVPAGHELRRPAPMFRRGRLDHLGLQAATLAAFETILGRLVARGASDGCVTDFGHILSIRFCDPDGLEGEVCITNPDAEPGVHRPPGTLSRRYHPSPGTASSAGPMPG